MAQDPAIVPIPGCKSRQHLDDNLGAIAIELNADDLAYLDALMPAPTGPRLPREQVYQPRV
jgi:aryl-alcohol dehydrogenase-like predicted oxidoreductase